MSDRSGLPPAGWYDDPAEPGAQRYWDGTAWTTEVRSPAVAAAPVSPTGGWDLGWLLFSFRGRAHRAHFWGGFGIQFVALFVASIAAVAAGGSVGALVIVAAWAGSLWVGLALPVKRWHDRDKSALWLLIVLVPFIGLFWALIEAGFLAGTAGPNRYGADPRR